MPAVSLDPSARRRSLAAAISAMFVVNLVFFLSPPLMAVVLARHGADAAAIGINAAAMAAGTFVVAPFAPALMARLGPARVMRWSLLVAVAMLLAMPAWVDPWLWLVPRILLGAAGSLCWIASEAWINALAEESRRGRVMSFYAMAGYSGQALGPLTLLLAGTEGWLPFLVAAALTGVGVALVSLGGELRPDLGSVGKPPILRSIVRAPLPMFAVLVQAAAFQAYFSFFPALGQDVGLPLEIAFVLMTCTSLGGLLLQYPMGWLADRVNRVLLVTAWLGLGAVAAALLPLLAPLGLPAIPFFMLLGAMISGTYALSLVLVGARFRGADLAAAATAFTIVYNIGAMAGPLGAGLVIEATGPGGLSLTMAIALGAVVPIGLWSLRRRIAVLYNP